MIPEQFVGIDTPRPEGSEKAAGKARYIQDISSPGMLFGKIKFSEYAYARIKSIDISKAEKLPGVKTVLTGYNTPEIRMGFLKDNYVLKKDIVRHFRDEVAAVAAVDMETAERAIELIEVEYEPLAGVFSPEEALAEGAPLLHESTARGIPVTSNVVPMSFRHLSGDLEKAKDASRTIVTGEYSTQLMQHSCMGTSGCIAEFDMHNNLTIHAKTQIPFLAQKDFSEALLALGLKGKSVRVVVPALGGAFGSGLDTHVYEYISILLAFKSSHPVKITYDRHEEFSNLSPRQSARIKISQGCDEQGKLTFREMEILQDNGPYVSWGATYPSVMMVSGTSLYRVPSVNFDSKLVYTNNTYCQAMRGYGSPEATWAIECNLDELATTAGIDPLEIRRINCNQPNEITPMKLQVSTCGLKDCMENATRKIDWHADRPAKEPHKKRGVGIASLCHVGGSARVYRSDASGIIIKLDDFGYVNVYTGGVEIGQGYHSALTIGISEYLGVLQEKIRIVQVDTDTCPWDVGTHASRGAFSGLNAAKLAVEKARNKIFELAEEIYPQEVKKNLAKLLRKNPEYVPPELDVEAAAKSGNFELKNSVVYLKNAPDEDWLKLDLARLLRAVHYRGGGQLLTFEAVYDPPNELPDWKRGVGNMSSTYAYGTHTAEVEVDTETGEVTILKYVASHDVGRVLNPQTLKGQVYGSIAQGIGNALYEEILCKDGKILNPGFTDYKIPTAKEMNFPIELDFVETHDEFGPFGAKGIGECGMIPIAPAIANAIYDAVGVRMRDLPMTPEKILKKLKEKS